MASPQMMMAAAAASVPTGNETQKHWQQSEADDDAANGECQNHSEQQQQQGQGGRHCCSRRRSFTIAPIDGMEWLQKCHPTYAVDGDMAAKRFLQEKKVNLSRRFQLIDRGYVLKLKEANGPERKKCSECGREGSLFGRLTVHMLTGRNCCVDGDDAKMAAINGSAQQQQPHDNGKDEANGGAGIDDGEEGWQK